MRTVRFWVFYRNSFVRLSLRPGQTLRADHGGRTDGGDSHTGHRWHYDAEGGMVGWEGTTWGRDCDGRYESGNTSAFPVGNAAKRDMGELLGSDYTGILAPEWTTLERIQRDDTAEAAGY